jgi:hypothetical protein
VLSTSMPANVSNLLVRGKLSRSGRETAAPVA